MLIYTKTARNLVPIMRLEALRSFKMTSPVRQQPRLITSGPDTHDYRKDTIKQKRLIESMQYD